MKQNVEITVMTGVCTSCGICKNICPKRCISFVFCDGKYQPKIENDTCVECGLCLKICPGIFRSYPKKQSPLKSIYGDYESVYNAWSRNPVLRHVSASGGVVSTFVEVLLNTKVYGTAFMVDRYSYTEQLKSKPVKKGDLPKDWRNSNYPKSRYLPISHENAVSYMKNNPKERIIFIGSSCAITGLRRVAELLKRDPDQDLFIGLFCDCVFNYQVIDYFSNELCGEKTIVSLHFKNKESGGWPGDMKVFYEDGSIEYKSKDARGNAKKYFMLESCLYCIDKLNVNADVSVGDNYTDQNSSKLGSNSVVIRTKQGCDAWECAKSSLEYEAVDAAKLRTAQYLDGRLNNLYYGALKEKLIKKKIGVEIHLNEGVLMEDRPILYEQAWNVALTRVKSGEKYLKLPQLIGKEKGKIEKLRDRVYYALRRRFYKE